MCVAYLCVALKNLNDKEDSATVYSCAVIYNGVRIIRTSVRLKILGAHGMQFHW